MRTLLGEWKVKKIEVDEDGSIYVTRATTTKTVRIIVPNFGIGRKGKKAAALARFVARHGLGNARRLYRLLSTMRRDFVGELPLSFPDCSSNSVSAIDDNAMEKAIAATSLAAIEKADEMAVTKAERAVLHRKIIASAVFGVDLDGVIDSLTDLLGQPRICPLKVVKSDDVDALTHSRPETSATNTID